MAKNTDCISLTFRIEGLDSDGTWTTASVSNDDNAATFDSLKAANDAIEDLVKRLGWKREELRIEEVQS